MTEKKVRVYTGNVSRVSVRSYNSRLIGSKARRIETKILKGADMICLRLYGTQQREYLPVLRAFEAARWDRIRSERAMTLNFKARKRGSKS